MNQNQWDNPLLQNFNTYMANNSTPFQHNQLLNQNVHAMGNLNEHLKQRKTYNTEPVVTDKSYHTDSKLPPKRSVNTRTSKNLIDEIFKPEKIKCDNRDIIKNYKEREQIQSKTINPENIPYKIIIKDKVVTKPVRKSKDLVVHESTDADRDINKFQKDLSQKKQEKKKINQELSIQFNENNRDTHQEKFDMDGTFIKNLSYSSNTFGENKDDYVDFYRKCQKEAEEGKEMCDQIINRLVDTGLIKADELPSEFNDSDDTPISNQIPVNQSNKPVNQSNKPVNNQITTNNKPVKAIKIQRDRTL